MFWRTPALALFFIAIAVSAQAAVVRSPQETRCARHVYNSSGETWEVEQIFEQGGKQVLNEKTMVAPGTNLEIEYLRGYDAQHIRLTNESKTYSQAFSLSFYAPGFSPINNLAVAITDALYPCVHIDHSGNTGLAVLNEPVEGDVTLIAMPKPEPAPPAPPPTRAELEAAKGCPPGWSSWLPSGPQKAEFDRCMGLFRPWMQTDGAGFWYGTEPPGFQEDGPVYVPAY